MQIQNISKNNLYNRTTSFEARFNTKEAVSICREFDESALKQLKKEGFSQGVIVAIVNKLNLSPKFQTLSKDEKFALLLAKCNEIIESLQTINIEELAKKFYLRDNVKKYFIKRQELIKRNNRILELYKEKRPIKEIAEMMNLTAASIRNILSTFNVSLTDDIQHRRDVIIKLVKAGYSDSYIAKAINKSLDTVQIVRREANLPPNSKISTRDKLIATQLRLGATREALAEKFNLCKATISHIAEKHSSFALKIADRDKKIVELFKKGFTRKQIAKEIGVSYDTVLRTLRKELA